MQVYKFINTTETTGKFFSKFIVLCILTLLCKSLCDELWTPGCHCDLQALLPLGIVEVDWMLDQAKHETRTSPLLLPLPGGGQGEATHLHAHTSNTTPAAPALPSHWFLNWKYQDSLIQIRQDWLETTEKPYWRTCVTHSAQSEQKRLMKFCKFIVL